MAREVIDVREGKDEKPGQRVGKCLVSREAV